MIHFAMRPTDRIDGYRQDRSRKLLEEWSVKDMRRIFWGLDGAPSLTTRQSAVQPQVTVPHRFFSQLLASAVEHEKKMEVKGDLLS